MLLDGPHSHGERFPVTLVGTALGVGLGLLMLYVPYQFQTSLYLNVYPSLRTFGVAFAVGGLCMVAPIVGEGLPPWLGRLGKVLLAGMLTTFIVAVLVPAGIVTRALICGGVVAVLLRTAVFPQTEDEAFRRLYTIMSLALGLYLMVRGNPLPHAIYGDFSPQSGPLFLIVGGGLVLARMPRLPHRPPLWGAFLVTALPYGWSAVFEFREGHLAGAYLHLVLTIGAVVYGVYVRRPWIVCLTGLRRRLVIAAVVLVTLPLFGLGAGAVFAVQTLDREEALRALTLTALRIDQTLYDSMQGETSTGRQDLTDEFPLIAPDPAISVSVVPLDSLPLSWSTDWLGSLEEVSPQLGLARVVFIRHPEVGTALVVRRQESKTYPLAARAALAILAVTGALAALAAAAALAWAKQLVRPLAQVRDVARAIGRQHFTARAPIPAHGADEVTDLAIAINEMADTLQDQRHALAEQQHRLEDSLALIDAIFATAPIGLCFLDTALRFVRINGALEAMDGVPLSEHLGRPISEVLPDLAVVAEPTLRRVMSSGKPIVGRQVTGRTPADPDHDHHWLASLYPVYRADGEILGTGIVLADVTENQRTLMALSESESRLAGQKQILELIAKGALLVEVLDAITRFVESHSKHCLCSVELLGRDGIHLHFAAAQSLPKGFVRATDGHTVGPAAGSCGTAVFRRKPVLVTDVTTDPLWASHRGTARDYGIAACWVTPIFDHTDAVTSVMTLYFGTQRGPTPNEANLVDIAVHLVAIAIERQRAEESQESKLQSLVQHTTEGVLAIDENRRIIVANDTARRFLGLTDDPGSQLAEDIGLPVPLVDVLERATEPDIHQPEHVRFAVGEREYRANVSPVVAQLGRRYGAIAFLTDVTAEMQFQRLQESFVANASHELRGPLTTLSATLEAMADGLVKEEDRPRYLRSMLAEMERLRRLTHEISEVSRLDAGVERFDCRPRAISPLLERVGEEWTYRCAGAGLTLRVDSLPVQVIADGDRVIQVLTNLMENAVRHTPAGRSVHIFALQEGNSVRVSVADTGAGISAEHLPHVWGRFYKVDRARTRTLDSGTGLGLSIVKHLVEQMNGEVHVESAPGAGSVFSFTLPRA